MRRHLLALALALLPLAATAQQAQPVPVTVPATADTAQTAKAAELEPFLASYLVYKGGKHAEQSTVFYEAGETYRPLSQATVNKTVFTRKQTVGVYDWASREARWSGEVKDHRRGPIALQDGDMTGLLINLAVIRDAEPGKTLRYRFVDDGRTRDHVYVVAEELESINVGGLGYKAMKATRAKDENEETVIWVAKNVPTPIRILQRENGEDTYDLRLVEYKGAE